MGRAARGLDSGFCHLGALLGGGREAGRKRMPERKVNGSGGGEVLASGEALGQEEKQVWEANTGAISDRSTGCGRTGVRKPQCKEL